MVAHRQTVRLVAMFLIATSYFTVITFLSLGELKIKKLRLFISETNVTPPVRSVIQHSRWKRRHYEVPELPYDPFFSEVNCSAVLAGNETEIDRIQLMYTNKTVPSSTLEETANQLSNCSDYKHANGFITNELTENEHNFAIAYSILVYTDFKQFVHLFRSIYRPQNYYCIHADARMRNAEVREAVALITSCFPNIILPDVNFRILWGGINILKAELQCMEMLLKYKGWMYLINLTGQEFPLKTNKQLVEIMKEYHGANDVDGSVKQAVYVNHRWKGKGEPPYNLTMVKGSTHITASRAFIEFIIRDPISHTFFEYLNGTVIPDEVFFNTLHHNSQLGTPGAFNGTIDIVEAKPFMSRLKRWTWAPKTCHGKSVHSICVFGVMDVPSLLEQPQLFVNKFHRGYQPVALHCMEQWHRLRTLEEYEGKYVFNASAYGKLPHVIYRANTPD